MDVEEAVELKNMLHPKRVIPTHYGEIVGNKEMAFTPSINCEILL